MALSTTDTTGNQSQSEVQLNEKYIQLGSEVKDKIAKSEKRTLGGVTTFVGMMIALLFISINGDHNTTYSFPLMGTITQLDLIVFTVVLFTVLWAFMFIGQKIEKEIEKQKTRGVEND